MLISHLFSSLKHSLGCHCSSLPLCAFLLLYSLPPTCLSLNSLLVLFGSTFPLLLFFFPFAATALSLFSSQSILLSPLYHSICSTLLPLLLPCSIFSPFFLPHFPFSSFPSKCSSPLFNCYPLFLFTRFQIISCNQIFLFPLLYPSHSRFSLPERSSMLDYV